MSGHCQAAGDFDVTLRRILLVFVGLPAAFGAMVACGFSGLPLVVRVPVGIVAGGLVGTAITLLLLVVLLRLGRGLCWCVGWRRRIPAVNATQFATKNEPAAQDPPTNGRAEAAEEFVGVLIGLPMGFLTMGAMLRQFSGVLEWVLAFIAGGVAAGVACWIVQTLGFLVERAVRRCAGL